MSNRPHSRKRHTDDTEATVHKRGDGIGGKPYNEDKEESNRSSYEGREPQTRASGGNSSSRGLLGDLIGSAIVNSIANSAQSNSEEHNNSQQQYEQPRPQSNPYQQSHYGYANPNNNRRRGGGSLLRWILLALVLFLIFSLLSRGCATEDQQTVATPTPTANTNTNTANVYNFGTETTNNVTYTNASSNQVNTNVVSGARDKFTKLVGNGNDQITLLLYLCGTDLESKYGMATTDLQEMLNAKLSDKITIVIQTGGTKQWRNNVMTNSAIERYVITANEGLQKVNYSSRGAMTDAAVLSDFIKWGSENFPANRYILDLWDHGGGSLSGYGYDELYPNGSMTVDKLASALNAGGIKFDIIGFDACLMANMETAIAVEPYADYLLASEETEPGTGWYYTDWLTKLSQNTSMSSVEIGKNVIDDFCTVTQSGSTARDENTLSIIDLAEFKATVPAALSAMSAKMTNDIASSNYQNYADARSVTKEFAKSQTLDQIDLVHFCETLNTEESKKLSAAIKSSVKYNRCRNVKNAYGLSIFFPYRNTRYVSSIIQLYKNISFNDEYATAIRNFASLQASGQLVSNSTSNPLFDLLTGGQTYNDSSYNTIDLTDLFTNGYGGYGSLLDLLGGGSQVIPDNYANNSYELFNAIFGRSHIDTSDLVLSDKNGQKVLSLSDEDWALVQDVKLNVWVDDGSGYIDLGNDNIFEFNEDGDLVIDYDGYWVAINGQVIAYHVVSSEPAEDGTWVTRGYVPAMLNDEEVKLIIEFAGEDEAGTVVGAEKVYDDEVITTGKILPINEGDTIDFICDYYDYEGNFDDRYFISDQITVDENGLSVSDVNISNEKVKFGYILQDIYGTERRTEFLDN